MFIIVIRVNDGEVWNISLSEGNFQMLALTCICCLSSKRLKTEYKVYLSSQQFCEVGGISLGDLRDPFRLALYQFVQICTSNFTSPTDPSKSPYSKLCGSHPLSALLHKPLGCLF